MIIKVPFYLDVTLCCGQVFRWDKIGDWWYGVAGDKAFKIRQLGEKVEFANADEAFVKNYFGIEDDLDQISASINKDVHIAKALNLYWGLRVIRQEPWECLISYICATYKSIPAIKLMLNNMAKKFGQKTTIDTKSFYTFPRSEKLAKATEKQLAECGLGYRAKYVLATAKEINDRDVSLDLILKQPYDQAKKALMELPGVGAKVADCVLLFSLGKTEAFPVDVWVKRVVLNYYGDKLAPDLKNKLTDHDSLSSGDYQKLNDFGRSYFGKYAGYAQEYLYHYERMMT